jgi:hypothetical protein
MLSAADSQPVSTIASAPGALRLLGISVVRACRSRC